jgi:hypothetical protein
LLAGSSPEAILQKMQSLIPISSVYCDYADYWQNLPEGSGDVKPIGYQVLQIVGAGQIIRYGYDILV